MALASGKTLLIVESPKKARTISALLAGQFRVEASLGHVRDLPARQLGVDVEGGFAPTYVPVPRARARLAQLRSAAAGATRVLLATDPDREGEAIAWHLVAALGLRPGSYGRVAFHEITARAVREALARPREIDGALVDAQQARRILDRLVGYKVSPLLWRKVEKGTSAGRVQSVALRLIVEREREIEAFTKREYWRIAATLAPASPPSEEFRAGLVEIDGQKAEIKDEATARATVEWLRDPAASFSVVETERKTRERTPPPPFTTSTLQQAAAGRLRIGAKRTMALAQSLYESGLITYHRTDAVFSAPEAVAAAREAILARFGPAHLPASPRRYASRQKNAQEAHEAIRPTDPTRAPGELTASLPAEERRLYELIWQRFLASQMSPARYVVDTAEIAVSHPSHRGRLRARATTLVFPGYLAVYGIAEDDEEQPRALDDEEEAPANRRLPSLRVSEPLDCRDVEPTQHFTKPPPRFTEASLVRALESLGIGRPSTYATILATIEERGYVRLASDRGERLRSFAPTGLGRAANDFLCAHFAEVVDTAFTARLEDELDAVAAGALGWRDLLARFYARLATSLAAAAGAAKVEVPAEAAPAASPAKRASPRRAAPKRPAGQRRSPPKPVGKACPRCGKPLVERTQRATGTAFLGCSGYPGCRYTAPLPTDGK